MAQRRWRMHQRRAGRTPTSMTAAKQVISSSVTGHGRSGSCAVAGERRRQHHPGRHVHDPGRRRRRDARGAAGYAAFTRDSGQDRKGRDGHGHAHEQHEGMAHVPLAQGGEA